MENVQNKTRDLTMEKSTDCDKCNQPVPIENDATVIEGIIFGPGIIFQSRARHFLTTDVCQGSPSRAQYIEGQTKDMRGYPYDKKLEPLYRTGYELLRAKYTDNKTLSEGVVTFLIDNLAKWIRLSDEEEKRQAEELKTRGFAEITPPKLEIRERRLLPPKNHQAPEALCTPARGSEKLKIKVVGEEQDLDPIEYKLLKVLSSQEGAISGKDLSIQVWGEPKPLYLIAQGISRLRKKIEQDRKKPSFINTIKGQGYQFLDPEKKIVLQE